ncbi:MAG: SDR family oxidoreductase [Sumerlaeia bacterium]
MPDAPEKPLILVTGATGYVGGRLVPELVAAGYRVRVMTRDPRRLKDRLRRWGPDVHAVSADVFDYATLREACRGVSVAYYLVHSMTEGAGFEIRDIQGGRNFALACEDCGVQRIVYLGGLGSDHAVDLSPHLRSRHEVGDALRAFSVPVTELRAAIIIGSGSASFTIIRDLVRKLPIMITPAWVRSRCEPIAIRQVLAYLVGVLREPRTVGETLEIGGGYTMTYEEMLVQAAEAMRCRTRIVRIGMLSPRISSYWLNLFTDVPFQLAKALVEGLRNDVVTSDQRIREWIPVPDLTYREAVELALKRIERGDVPTRWFDRNTLPSLDLFNLDMRVLFSDRRRRVTPVPPAKLFEVVKSIGGKTGYYYGNWLWTLRGWLDRLVGGVGMRTGRIHPEDLAVGDPVDFWRVEDLEEDRLLRLRAEMKVPGIALLEFRLRPRRDGKPGTEIVQLARYWPNGGIWGRLYWYGVLPLHGFVFNGMLNGIVREAERRHAGEAPCSERAPLLRHPRLPKEDYPRS